MDSKQFFQITQKTDDREEQARENYYNFLGQVVSVYLVMGYEGTDSVEVHCDPPARVKVVQTKDVDVTNREGPFWNVALAEPHPALRGVRNLWIDGTDHMVMED